MVAFKNWEAFAKAVTELYTDEPTKTRYCIRWRHDLGLLAIKATDDTRCYVFKARSAVFLNRFDALTRSLMARMQNITAPVFNPAAPPASAAGASAAAPPGPPGGAAGGAGAAEAKEGADAPAKNAAKKKKGKKKR